MPHVPSPAPKHGSDSELLSHNQTIVYALHDSIGHLGIFVSGAVGQKEHREFASNIELINLISAGVYQAVIEDAPPTGEDAPEHGSPHPAYVMSIEHRTLDDVRRIVEPSSESDRRFAAVAHISEINLALYRNFAQPLMRMMVTTQSADLMRRLHPLRISYEYWSSLTPLAPLVEHASEEVRADRRPVAPSNPFLRAQTQMSDAIIWTLDTWRNVRDTGYERMFELMYGSPVASALAGLDARPSQSVRPVPGVSPEHREYVAHELTVLRHEVAEGGLLEAGIRALAYVTRDARRRAGAGPARSFG